MSDGRSSVSDGVSGNVGVGGRSLSLSEWSVSEDEPSDEYW